VFEPHIVIPYVIVTTNKCHTNIKISKDAMILWSSKFMKVASDALAHNANVV
jgi:hypothetical protein